MLKIDVFKVLDNIKALINNLTCLNSQVKKSLPRNADIFPIIDTFKITFNVPI